MVSAGVEMLVGVTSDPVFGPLVGVGLGGAQAEIFADARFRAAPLTDQDVDAMVNGSRAARLLGGFRGKPPADVAARLVMRVSCWPTRFQTFGSSSESRQARRRRGCQDH